MKGTVCMNLHNMKQTLSENLKEAASIFVRVGKSHIINLIYVYNIAILHQKLTLSEGENYSYTVSIPKMH